MKTFKDETTNETILLTHDQNQITIQSTVQRFKPWTTLDLGSFPQGTILKVINLVNSLVFQTITGIIKVIKGSWEVVETPASFALQDGEEFIDAKQTGKDVIWVTSKAIKVLDECGQIKSQQSLEDIQEVVIDGN